MVQGPWKCEIVIGVKEKAGLERIRRPGWTG